VGLSHARVTLANARRPELAPIEVDALADTGAVHLCIPEHIAIQLELEEVDRRELTIADGSRHKLPYVGPILISVANRKGLAGAMVLGNQVLLGAIPMEDLDLIVLPGTRQVVPNPANPNIAGTIAVGVLPARGD
jgi:clan AA aspartic protease